MKPARSRNGEGLHIVQHPCFAAFSFGRSHTFIGCTLVTMKWKMSSDVVMTVVATAPQKQPLKWLVGKLGGGTRRMQQRSKNREKSSSRLSAWKRQKEKDTTPPWKCQSWKMKMGNSSTGDGKSSKEKRNATKLFKDATTTKGQATQGSKKPSDKLRK